MFNVSKHLDESRMVKNRSGGKTFAIDPWDHLVRVLILGTEGGTYYASESKMTQQAIKLIDALLVDDGPRVVKTAVEVSVAGRAPKNDYAIYVLARASVTGDEATRKAANDAMPKVCRTGTHLFQWVGMIKNMGKGFSYGRRRALTSWYFDKSGRDLAYQVMKYQSRRVEGQAWNHRDILRLFRPKVEGETYRALVHWIVKGWDGVGPEPHPDEVLRRIWAYERLKETDDLKEALRLIGDYRLPHDVIDGKWKGGKHAAKVWDTLVEAKALPYFAMMRNLGNMSKHGYLVPGTPAARKIADRISDEQWVQKARVHPFGVLTAMMTYKSGQGARGKGTWTPVKTVVNALDSAFYASFGNVPDTGKNTMVCLDVSGSMAGYYGYRGWGNHSVSGLMGVPGLSPRVASAAMSMIFARTQANHMFMAFSSGFIPLDIQDGDRLDEVVTKVSRLPFDRTNCAQPMLTGMDVWKQHSVAYNAFVVFTDNETNCNTVHPHVALRDYRRLTKVDAKLIVMAMTADKFTIAEPGCNFMLDLAGLDSAAPKLVTDFIGGAF